MMGAMGPFVRDPTFVELGKRCSDLPRPELLDW